MEKQTEAIVIEALKKTVQSTSINAWLIGGFVRDRILNIACKDIDIVVTGSGIEFAERFAQILDPTCEVIVFKNFGTAQVKYQDFEIEFVGARKESYARDSRKPVVEDGTLEDDQKRRDFTINALSISLNEPESSEIIDPFNGLDDLKNKIIRTPLHPDQTFIDDPLRMLRAIRFATRLQFQIAEETFNSISQNAARIHIISAERISEEFNKIMLADKPSIGFKLLYNTGLLAIIFPELVALQGVEWKGGKGHKDNFYHTLEVLDNVAMHSQNLWLRWAALLHDIAKPATKRFVASEGWTFHGHEDKGARMVKPLFRRFKLPLNEKMKYVEKLVFLHLRPIALAKDIVTDSAVRRLMVEAGEAIDDLLILCQSDITSKNEAKKKKYLKNLELVKEKIALVSEKDRLRNWQPPITGNDIMQYFSISQPRMIGELKLQVREAILDGVVPDQREAALEYMIQQGKQMGLELLNQETRV